MDGILAAIGDNFDKIQAAFGDKTQGIAEKLADAVIDADNAEVITTHGLYAWIKKYGPDSSTNKEQSDAQAEIRRLQK